MKHEEAAGVWNQVNTHLSRHFVHPSCAVRGEVQELSHPKCIKAPLPQGQ